MNIPPVRGPDERPASKEPLSSNPFGDKQVPSGDSAQSLWDGLVHYVFFGWVVAFFKPKKEKDLEKQITDNFDQAQQLLNGRIDKKSEDAIKTFFREQKNPLEVQKKWETFLNEALRLQNMTPRPLSPSHSTLRLSELRKSVLGYGLVKDTLIDALTQEILFVTIINNMQPFEEERSDFHSFIEAPFALQFRHELLGNTIAILISDPMTKEVRRMEITIPENIDPKDLGRWLKNPKSLDIPTWIQSAYVPKIKRAFADTIFSISTPPKKARKGEIYFINGELSYSPTRVQNDHRLVPHAATCIKNEGGTISLSGIPCAQEDIEVKTLKVNETQLEVEFSRNNITHTVRYTFEQGETLEKLIVRICRDHTLERDIMLATLKFQEGGQL